MAAIDLTNPDVALILRPAMAESVEWFDGAAWHPVREPGTDDTDDPGSPAPGDDVQGTRVSKIRTLSKAELDQVFGDYVVAEIAPGIAISPAELSKARRMLTSRRTILEGIQLAQAHIRRFRA